MGQYEQALPLSQQALEIHGKILGTDHPKYSTCLNNLALLYQSIGQYEQALPLHQQALEITGKIL
jgi:tetratricopeptide (TPR) repeat protein